MGPVVGCEVWQELLVGRIGMPRWIIPWMGKCRPALVAREKGLLSPALAGDSEKSQHTGADKYYSAGLRNQRGCLQGSQGHDPAITVILKAATVTEPAVAELAGEVAVVDDVSLQSDRTVLREGSAVQN